MQDLYNNISGAITLAPAARTASANGTGVDLAGYTAAMVVITTGTITDGTHAIKLQESDDNSTYTDVAASQVQGTNPSITSSNGNSVYKLGYLGYKRYIRAVTTVTGATTGGVYQATVLRGEPRHVPVT